MSSEPIRVVVVDDHDMIRDAIRRALKKASDIELVGEAESGEEAVALCERVPPDVVIMDLMLPKLNGVSAISRIHSKVKGVRTIAVSAFCDEELVQSAIQAGAQSYLIKGSIKADDIVREVRAVNKGGSNLCPEATQALIRATQKPKGKPILAENFTSRELKVLDLMCQGLSNREIGRELEISRATVATHIRSILPKIEAKNRVHAAALAVRYKLVSLDL